MRKWKKKSELYLPPEEFARILGVRKHTLFHYDEIGLFSPALKEENGYRYYLYGRWTCSRSFVPCRSWGCPLGEIKGVYGKPFPGAFHVHDGRKKRQIDEEIRRLKNMKRFILHEEESVQLAMKAALDEPRLVERTGNTCLCRTSARGRSGRLRWRLRSM